jgi:hypothetical protein
MRTTSFGTPEGCDLNSRPAPKQSVIEHEENDCADDRNENAVNVEARNTGHAEGLKQIAADHRADNA